MTDSNSRDETEPKNRAQRRAAASNRKRKRVPRPRVWKPKNSPFYHMEFRYRGRRFTGSTKLRDKDDAIAYAAKEYEKAVAAYVNTGGAARVDMTILQVAERYYKDRGQFVADPNKLELSLDWLIDRVGENTQVREIDDAFVSKLMVARQEEYVCGNPANGRVSNTTVNHDVLDLIRLLLRRARINYKVPLPNEPIYRNHRLEQTTRVRELSVREEIRLLDAAEDGLRPVIKLALRSGLRRMNLSLKWDQVDFDEGCLKLVGKRNKPFEVTMTTAIREILKAEWKKEDRHETFVFTTVAKKTHTCRKTGYKFVQGERGPVTYGNLATAFIRARKKAAISDIRIHDLRKTAGARMLRTTGDLAAVQDLLVHGNIALTKKHYTNVKRADVGVRMEATEARYAELMIKAREEIAADREAREAREAMRPQSGHHEAGTDLG